MFDFCIAHILNTGVLKFEQKIRHQKVKFPTSNVADMRTSEQVSQWRNWFRIERWTFDSFREHEFSSLPSRSVGPPRYQKISWPVLEADRLLHSRFLSYWISLNLVLHVMRTSLRFCAPDQVQYCFTLRRVLLLSPILVSRISLLRIHFHPVLWIPYLSPYNLFSFFWRVHLSLSPTDRLKDYSANRFFIGTVGPGV